MAKNRENKSDKVPMRESVLLFIARIRELFPQGYPEMSGGCVKFGALLKSLYGGECYYDKDHVLTKIDGRFYDITGEVDGSNHLPTSEFDFSRWKTARIDEI